MTGRDFLVLAQALCAQASEAAWRTAVSRAYYAAFHVARELFEGLGFIVPHADRAHAYLWRRLTHCGDPRVQRAGSDLNTLRGERNRADYDFRLSFQQGVTQALVRMAEQVIQALDAAVADPTRSQITAEMARYERDVLQEVTWHP
jgi:uncharacterized protein (UPF0332 family)